mgnify:CR=1 FL=1
MMKKFVTSLALLAVFCCSFAQVPVLRSLEGEDITGQWLVRRAENDDEAYYMQYSFNVWNESGSDIVFDFVKVTVREVEGTINVFCFNGNCFTSDHVDDVSIASGEYLSFVADYMGQGPEESDGVTTLLYEFHNGDEVSWVGLSFIIGDHDGIDAPESNVTAKVYPNPVSEVSTFECSLPKAGSLQIYTCTGQKVAEYQLEAGDNRLSLNAADFRCGLYLCSVVVNGKIVTTTKMVVR